MFTAILAWVKSAKAFLKECLDSGMVLFRENCTPGEALESSYRQAFGTDFDRNDVIILMRGNDEQP